MSIQTAAQSRAQRSCVRKLNLHTLSILRGSLSRWGFFSGCEYDRNVAGGMAEARKPSIRQWWRPIHRNQRKWVPRPSTTRCGGNMRAMLYRECVHAEELNDFDRRCSERWTTDAAIASSAETK